MPKSGEIYDESNDIVYKRTVLPWPRDRNLKVNYKQGEAVYGDPETHANFLPKENKKGRPGNGDFSAYEQWKKTNPEDQSKIATVIQDMISPNRTGKDTWYGTYEGPAGTNSGRYQALHIVPMLDRLARDLATERLSLPELRDRALKYRHLLIPSVPKGVSPRVIPTTAYGRASFFKKLVDGNSNAFQVKYPSSEDF